MNGDYHPDPDDIGGTSESLNSDDVSHDDDNIVLDAANRWISVAEHQDADGRDASISRDIDALVQLKRLRKAL
ncbi:hypothetical protein H7K33_00435 [Mycobacterium paraense]|uniref:hypothetical protein n=1 Tax=Mycobacterium paraense TaxID=767916 RepID=UPI00115353B2|nr:hypothetical protein [Mycobacterium paraense]MCV7440686.1 hypothetical protein [Mycobacterium paraense]